MDSSGSPQSVVRRPSTKSGLHGCLEAPLRRPGLVGLATLLTLAAGVVASLVIPDRYRAAVRVRASWGDDSTEVRSDAETAGARLRGVRERVLDVTTLRRVLAEIRSGLPAGGETTRAEADVRALVDAITVKPEGRDVFRIEHVHRDPATAASIVNGLAADLVKQATMEDRRGDEARPANVQARLAEARRSMEEAGNAIRRFREGAPPGPSGEPSMASRLDGIDREKLAVSRDLRAARDRATSLRLAMEARTSGPVTEPSAASRELDQLRGELSRLRERYTEEHPDVLALLRRIRELETATVPPRQTGPDPELAAQRDELMGVEREIAALEARDRTIDAERARLLRSAPAQPRPEPSLETLAAEYDRAQASHLALLEESRRAEIASASQRPIVRFEVLEGAKAPEAPYFPDRRLFALGGLVLGVLLGLGLALLAEAWDRSIKGPEDLQETLPQPVLAELPFVKVRRSERRR